MAHYGYLRVSTTDQTTENQKMEIVSAGFAIEEFFSDDGVSGNKKATERPAFICMMQKMQRGDTVVATKVDRLGRNAADVLAVVEELKGLGVGVKIIQLGGVDLASTAGKLLLSMLAAVAEMERSLLIERTKAGMARTRAQGTKFGRPLTIPPNTLAELVEARNKGWTLLKMQEHYGIPKNSIDRNVKQWGDDLEGYKSEWAAREAQYKNKEVV